MQRPRQHIIETESRNKLEQIIPSNWNTNKLSIDYGLDYYIEIFKNEKSTGNIFFIQLKGTDKNAINNCISYQISTEHLNYWNSIVNPVLLIIYSTKTNQFWGIWTNKLKENIYTNNVSQKSFSIKLTENNLLTQLFFTELEQSFDQKIPERINITYRGNSEETKLLYEYLLKWLKYYFNGHIEISNHKLSNTCLFEFSRDEANNLNIIIQTSNKSFKLKPVNFFGTENFLFLPNIQTDVIPKQISESLLFFGLLFFTKNIASSIDILEKTIVDYSGDLIFTKETFFSLVNFALKEKQYAALKKLCNKLIENKLLTLFQYINMSILPYNYTDKDCLDLYQENLLTAIDSTNNLELKGTLSYNLANSYRFSHKRYSASYYYQLARKYDPKYLKKSYWWFEYAGILFLAGHYKISELFYLKSFEIDNSRNTFIIFGLIGDCKFFQGHFKEAFKYFEKSLKQEEKTPYNSEFYIKAIVSENLIALNLDSLNFDIELSTKLSLEALEEKNEEKLFESIKEYPLNSFAWFNYNVMLNSKGDMENALLACLVTVCIQENDIDAWNFALLSSLILHHFDLSASIYAVALNKIGKTFLNKFSQYILDQQQIPKDIKLSLIKTFSELQNKL